jgi:hypothetical protein
MIALRCFGVRVAGGVGRGVVGGVESALGRPLPRWEELS